MEGQSFSQGVKDELARDLPERACCRRSLLAGLLLAGGEIVGLEPLSQCILEMTSAASIRLILRLVRLFDGPPATWEAVRTRRLRVGTLYTVRIGPSPQGGTGRFAGRLGLRAAGERWSSSAYTPARRRCCKRAFAQGAFLVSGSVEDPHRGYHLEWTVRDPDFASLLADLLDDLALPVRRLRRRHHEALYVKAASDVARALTLMGATRGLLALEEIRSVKETKNLVHRRVNCETSNLARLGAAAAEQVAQLRRLESGPGMRRIPPDLRPLARARLRLPEASYRELGRALSPPLAKAAVGRKLQRLLRLVRTLLGSDIPVRKELDASGAEGTPSRPGPAAPRRAAARTLREERADTSAS